MPSSLPASIGDDDEAWDLSWWGGSNDSRVKAIRILYEAAEAGVCVCVWSISVRVWIWEAIIWGGLGCIMMMIVRGRLSNCFRTVRDVVECVVGINFKEWGRDDDAVVRFFVVWSCCSGFKVVVVHVMGCIDSKCTGERNYNIYIYIYIY